MIQPFNLSQCDVRTEYFYCIHWSAGYTGFWWINVKSVVGRMKTLAPQMTTNDPNRAHVWTDLASSPRRSTSCSVFFLLTIFHSNTKQHLAFEFCKTKYGRPQTRRKIGKIFSFCSHNVIQRSSALCRRHSHFEIKFSVWLGWQQSAAVTELEFAVGKQKWN